MIATVSVMVTVTVTQSYNTLPWIVLSCYSVANAIARIRHERLGTSTSTRYERTTSYFIIKAGGETVKKSNEKQVLEMRNEGLYLDNDGTTHKYMPHAIHPSIPLGACACSTVQKSRTTTNMLAGLGLEARGMLLGMHSLITNQFKSISFFLGPRGYEYFLCLLIGNDFPPPSPALHFPSASGLRSTSTLGSPRCTNPTF